MLDDATRFGVDFEIGDQVFGCVWYVRHEDMHLEHVEVEQLNYRRATKALQRAVREGSQ